jgi:hypothetical protein
VARFESVEAYLASFPEEVQALDRPIPYELIGRAAGLLAAQRS